MQTRTNETISFNYQLIPCTNLKDFLTTRYTIVYEAIRLIEGIPLFWEGHWNRLTNSLDAINSTIILQKEKFEENLALLITQNEYLNTNIRIEIFGENILMYAISAVYPILSNYENGVEVNFINAIRPNPTRKILRRSWAKMMELKINNSGVFESLMINDQGLITEGSHTNVFFIKGNTLYSAEESLILPGITRIEILHIAENKSAPLVYIPVIPKDVINFDAAFLCATSLHILPISKINEQSFDINNDLMRSLMLDFQDLIRYELADVKTKWGK